MKMELQLPVVEIYIGSPIEYESERAVLREIVKLLAQQNSSAIIFANINIRGRQIDTVVISEEISLIIEAKSSANPLRGDVNGDWEVLVASGRGKRARNFYQQTLDAKNALRDEMGQFARADVPYPSAALIFVPTIPLGSSICQGDFKVSIAELNGIAPLLRTKRAGLWSLDQWRKFAAHLRLNRIPNIAAALHVGLAEAEDIIDRYATEFQRTYGPLGGELIPYTCTVDGKQVTSDLIIEQGSSGGNLLLCGPSGCGKSLAGYRIGSQSFRYGRLPIFIRAQDFEGNLRDVVQREVTLLDAPSDKALMKACRILGRPVTFIIDGYNECPERERSRLTRSIAAATRRYEASIVMTAQEVPARTDLLNIQKICVLPPDAETKRAIAVKASGDAAILVALEPLLKSIDTGLEARLIGDVGGKISAGASRYALFDAYVRKKLGASATEGIRALARISGILTDRISFSLSVRDLERLAEQEAISPALLQELDKSRLLTGRGDRIAFGHELFLNAFAAEAVIRRAAGSAAAIVQALESPLHADRKSLIVGAIDDDALLASVLAGIADTALIEACLTGQCGVLARDWFEARCRNILKRMQIETAQVAFNMDEKGSIEINSSTLLSWTGQEKAFFGAIGALATEGFYMKEILEVAAAMDRRLEDERKRMQLKATEQKVALRSAMFREAYVFARALGLSVVSATLHHGRINRSRHASISSAVYDRLASGGLSNGQVYILLALNRHAFDSERSIAPLLPDLLRQYWPFAPYHLKLDLLMSAQFCARASNTERLAIVDALQELPRSENVWISTSIVDALKCLGALENDEDEHTEHVRGQIRAALADEDNSDMQTMACGIWFAQFDHPYDGSYCEAVSELAEEDKKQLTIMAAKGTEQETAFFVYILIAELAGYNDPGLANIIVRWTKLPAIDEVFPQGAMKVYMTAYIALARMTCALPETSGERASEAGASLEAAGQILYWLNRIDLSIDERRSACSGALTVLSRHEACLAAGVLSDLARCHLAEGLYRLPGTEPVHLMLGEFFRAEIVEICRQALLQPERQRGFFQHTSAENILDFALTGIGHWGGRADIALLRRFSDDRRLGRMAISAIKELEAAHTLN